MVEYEGKMISKKAYKKIQKKLEKEKKKEESKFYKYSFSAVSSYLSLVYLSAKNLYLHELEIFYAYIQTSIIGRKENEAKQKKKKEEEEDLGEYKKDPNDPCAHKFGDLELIRSTVDPEERKT